MLKTCNSDAIVIISNKSNGSVDMYKMKGINGTLNVERVAENIEPIDFYRYYDHNDSITNVNHHDTRFIASRDGGKMNITLCHDGTQFKTIADGNPEARRF